MFAVLVPWCFGLLAFAAVIWLAHKLCDLLFEIDRLEWLADQLEDGLHTINVSIFFSLPIVAAVGITYGCYRLGVLLMALVA